MNGILFVGGGKMMQAIAQGLIARGSNAATVAAIEPDSVAADAVRGLGASVFTSAQDAITSLSTWDAVVLAVKPQSMREALMPLRNRLDNKLIISIAAGMRTADLARWLSTETGTVQIVRAMPNTPALIRAGISGLYAPRSVSAENRHAAEALLNAVGKCVWFDDEATLDAVTAVSGSGPAYVFYAIESLEQAATAQGIAPDVARLLAIETFRGAALLAAQSTEAPAQLRANVTSKRGTTEAALRVLNAANASAIFADAVAAATARAAELGDELGRD